jgi:DNA-binding YbaB/EbfC family protein
MKGMGSMGKMLKQIQQMQGQMMKIQEGLAQKTVEGSAGGGMVKAVANGRQEIVSISIEPEVVNPDDVEILEDLVLAAVKQAQEKAQELGSEEMKKMTGGLGMNIPGLF